MVAPVRDADQHEVRGAVVALDDLVSDAGERSTDVVGVEDRPRDAHATVPDVTTPPRTCEEAR
jgi:hypothetical protein